MIGQALLVAGFVLIVGAFVTVKVRNRTVKMVFVAPLWFVAVSAVILAITGVVYLSELRVYDQCVQRAERSVGARVQTIQLYDTIDILTSHPEFTHDPVLPGLPSLREALDINQPILLVSACHHP